MRIVAVDIPFDKLASPSFKAFWAMLAAWFLIALFLAEPEIVPMLVFFSVCVRRIP